VIWLFLGLAWGLMFLDAYLITHRKHKAIEIDPAEEERLLYEPMTTPTAGSDHFVLPEPQETP
jgi:hypothetical protein